MIDQEIRIKMAEREGYKNLAWNNIGWVVHGFDDDKPYAKCESVPTYDNENDLYRYIRGMDYNTRELYCGALLVICGDGAHGLICATVDQIQEAIKKAEGWE